MTDDSTVAGRAARFARGELRGAELEAFERELDTSDALRREVAAAAAGVRAPSAPASRSPAALELGRELGRGGNARVVVARQLDLGRDVAVKLALSGDAAATQRLLLEARLTGALEHPGIVPVHFLSRGECGELRVAYKRIEGKPWSELVRDGAGVRSRFGRELLDWNLTVLASVAQAVGFAHSRGVIHRDLKPANVMIGLHGEVYVVDWGQGGVLSRDPLGLLPWVGDRSAAGTRSYMAPEQLPESTTAPTPATDVHLLGAILFELLTGAPPYPTESQRTQPLVFPRQQSELVEVARRALDPEPARRYVDGRAFHAALDRANGHQTAERLCSRAAEALASAAVHQRASKTAEAARAVAEAELGLSAARALWPDSPAVEALAIDVVTLRVENALEAKSPQIAAQALAEHGAPLPHLEARVHDALTAAARLQGLSDQLDPATGLRRRAVGFMAVVTMLGGFLGARLGFPQLYSSRWALTINSIVFVGAVVGAAAVLGPALRASALNRQLIQTLGAITLGQVLSRGTAAVLELPRPAAVALELPVLLTTCLLAALAFHPSFFVSVGVCLVGLGAALLQPARVELIFAVTSWTMVASIGLIWAAASRRQKNEGRS
ncbi:MAG: serine/threonine protein kinase [Myxococcaceae bacterium]|nr:serine/threonine protein kinase [Myxococcaceae bacterium]